jgi:hypothetical protein
MIKITRKFSRNDLDVPWHLDQPFKDDILTQEFIDHVESKYKDKIINQTYVRTEDDMALSITYTATWSSLADYQEYMNDPICIAMFARRDAHNAEFGIVSEPSTITEI